MKPDAWKLYCEAFRALWPRADDVSNTVSPAALQEMVDRIIAVRPEGEQRQVSEYEYEQSRRILKWGEHMIVATRGRRPEVTVDLVVRGLDELAALLQSPMNARPEKQ